MRVVLWCHSIVSSIDFSQVMQQIHVFLEPGTPGGRNGRQLPVVVTGVEMKACRPEGLVHCGQDLLCLCLAGFNAVAAIREDFRLHDGDKSILLAYSSVASEPIGILMDSLHRCSA